MPRFALILLVGIAGILPASAERPNVLFISIDDLNDWVGALGGNPQAITPNIDRLFEQSAVFANAHCSQAVCIASRNSLLSGLHPTTSGWYDSIADMRRSFDAVMGDHKMLPQHFKDAGYRTMATGKIFHRGVTDYNDRVGEFWDDYTPGFQVPERLKKRGDGYGGLKFYPFPKEGSQIVNHYGKEYAHGHSLCYGPLDRADMPNGKMFDELISEWAVDQLSQEQEEPFFLAVGFLRPHVPYTAPREFFELYQLEEIEIPPVPENEMADIPLMGKAIAHGTLKMGDHKGVVDLSSTYWKELVYGYLACVSFVDHELGKVLTALENSPYADNTLIVLWSDHGQHLGEKKHWRKQALWEESTRVPLAFRLPGQTEGSIIQSPVSLLDIYPTLVDLCKLPAAPKLDGNSLLPLIEDPNTKWERPVLSTWYYGNHSVRSQDWRYIRYRDGTEELYYHPSDPGEHRNLAALSKFNDIIIEHRKWLPENDALPAGNLEWEPDTLDRRVAEWMANDSVPNWLQ